MDAGLVIAADLIFAQEIIGVFVADGDAEAAVVFEDVFFEDAVFDAPAKEEAVFAIVFGDAGAHGGPLRAAAGMQAEAGVVFAGGIFDDDIVGLLEADAVAVVI